MGRANNLIIRDGFIMQDGVLMGYRGQDVDIVVPDGITGIGDNAFAYGALKSIVIPEGVTGIGQSAFKGCGNLTSVSMPSTLMHIDRDAFSGCKSLTNVTIPNDNTRIADGAFQNCIGLKDGNGFVIVKGILFSYHGPDGDVVVPDGVDRIASEAFKGSAFNTRNISNITIPKSVTSIGSDAFLYTTLFEIEENWHEGALYLNNCLIKVKKETAGTYAIAEGTRCIAGGAFRDCKNLTGVLIPESVITIGDWAFSGCNGIACFRLPKSVRTVGSCAFPGGSFTERLELESSSMELPEKKLSVFDRIPSDNLTVFAPNLPFSMLRQHGLESAAIIPFLLDHLQYTDLGIVSEYLDFIASQRKKLLPEILRQDKVGIIKMLADAKKITAKNIDDYLIPARQCKAEKCIAYLETLLGDTGKPEAKKEPAKKASGNKTAVNTLWDGEHFSLDGKKLLKYPEEPGRTRYEIPRGTVEIGKNAFYMTSLTEIVVPGSVTTVRNGAFTAKSGSPLFIRLPRSLKDLPSEAFVGGSFVEDMDIEDDTKYYYVSSPVKTLADDLCLNSYKKGCRCMVYTGGPLDDLYPTLKKFAVQGFLYATQHDLEDLSRWRGSYLDHIKRNEKTYLKQALSDAFLLNLMLEEGLLSEKGTRTLLDEAEANGRTDLTAALLEYRQKHFGDKSNDALSLSDDDPEFKRMQKMAARREAIKDQKGIKGIVFVQTGDMTYFGYYDEYTGAKDMTDLKDFIEARGGFLRSAVSSNTDYLICNDPNSDTVKSQKAKELGVPVITEDQFLKMAEEK